MIVPGGGLSKDGTRWVGCRLGFFLHVRVLSRLFRRLFIEGLMALHRAGELTFFNDLAKLSEPQAFATYLAPLRKTERVGQNSTGQMGHFWTGVDTDRFHRIRHYGMLASAGRKANIAKVRSMLGVEQSGQEPREAAEIIPLTLREPCPDCGGAMRITETFRRGQKPQSRAPPRKAAA